LKKSVAVKKIKFLKGMITLRVVVNGVAVVVNPFGWRPGFGLEDDE